MAGDPLSRPLIEIARELRDRRTSARELVEAAIARHDRFGVPKSHGCINLAPEDARRLFFFTEPEVPPGWHARLLPLKGTVVFVHQ